MISQSNRQGLSFYGFQVLSVSVSYPGTLSTYLVETVGQFLSIPHTDWSRVPRCGQTVNCVFFSTVIFVVILSCLPRHRRSPVNSTPLEIPFCLLFYYGYSIDPNDPVTEFDSVNLYKYR